jgi:nitrite reductase/ring-hydroxylating ferredoxin subunit
METLVHSAGTFHTLFLSGTALLLVIVACFFAYNLPNWIEHAPKKLTRVLNLARLKDQTKEAALEASAPSVSKENDFPSDWWTSNSLYQLERRAIFSKTWLHICHSSLFKKIGDYRTFSIAGFSFFLILGKDGRLRAFHNVCRHRAYTVATRESGCSRALMCKYHGWTYDTTGKLIKAPKFEDVAGFDKTQNGLYEIRTFIDSSGFVYVNFDIYGSDGLTIRVGVPIRARLTLVESWNIDAQFNWKLAVPSGVFRVGSLTRRSHLPDLMRSALRSLNMKSSRWPAEFELSPLTRLLRSPSGDLWLTIAIVPSSNTTCSIACSLYCSQLDLKADLPITAIKSDLNDSVQKLQLIFDEIKEDGTIADVRSQEPFLAEIKAHSRLERLTKCEVYPASRLRETSQPCKVADDFCKQLEIASGDKSTPDSNALAW